MNLDYSPRSARQLLGIHTTLPKERKRLEIKANDVLCMFSSIYTHRKERGGGARKQEDARSPNLAQSSLLPSPRRPPIKVTCSKNFQKIRETNYLFLRTSFSVNIMGSNISSPAQVSACSLPMADSSLKPSASIAASLVETTPTNTSFISFTCGTRSSGCVISSLRSGVCVCVCVCECECVCV